MEKNLNQVARSAVAFDAVPGKARLLKRTIRCFATAMVLAALSVPAISAFALAPVGPGNLGSISAPFSVSYGNSFQAPQNQFYDDYQFSLSPAGSLNTFAATIDLGNFLSIDNLQARLYSGAGPFVSTTQTPLIQAWSTAITVAPGITGESVVISPVVLDAGTYTLELRGNVNGSNGGSYAGVLNLSPDVSPVPEPATLAMMLVGFGIVGSAGIARRRSD